MPLPPPPPKDTATHYKPCQKDGVLVLTVSEALANPGNNGQAQVRASIDAMQISV